MALTDTAIKKIKPADKPIKLSDERGLFLQVVPAGGKWWRFRYRFDGKQKMLSLGTYPDVSLAKARDRRDEARRLLADGIDPSAHRKSTKSMQAGLDANTFEVIGREWHAKVASTQAESTYTKRLRFLEMDVFPFIGKRPIAELAAPDLLAVIHRIEGRGAVEIARRVHNICGRIFRYAVGKGLATRDPSRDIELKDILPPENVTHHASVTEPKAAGELLDIVVTRHVKIVFYINYGGRKWLRPIKDMTSPMRRGRCLSRDCRDVKACGAASPTTTGDLSMRYAGF